MATTTTSFAPQLGASEDYVIRSFQSDKPFDQMLKEHLAGDEMLAGQPTNEAEVDALEGTGYLRVGPYDGSAGRFGERVRCHTQVMSDLVETTATAFLGLNMTCAKCHDHKIDPISQQDYYRLRAIFENCAMNDNELVDLGKRREKVLRDIWEVDKAQQKVRDIETPVVTQIRSERLAKLSPTLKALFAKPEEDLDSSAREKVHLAKAEMEPTEQDILAAMSETQKSAHRTASQALSATRAKQTPPSVGYVTTRSRIPTPDLPSQKGRLPASRPSRGAGCHLCVLPRLTGTSQSGQPSGRGTEDCPGRLAPQPGESTHGPGSWPTDSGSTSSAVES